MRTRADSDIQDLAVVVWRRGQLLDAGFDLETSELLARECGVDLHALLDLVEGGCHDRLGRTGTAGDDDPDRHDRDEGDRRCDSQGAPAFRNVPES